MEPAHHRPHRDIEGGGGRRVAEVGQVDELDHPPGVLGQGSERGLHRSIEGASRVVVFGTASGSPTRRDLGGVRVVEEARPPTTVAVDVGVPHDSEQPSSRVLAIEGADGPEGSDERILDEILRFDVAAGDRARDPQHHIDLGYHEAGEPILAGASDPVFIHIATLKPGIPGAVSGFRLWFVSPRPLTPAYPGGSSVHKVYATLNRLRPAAPLVLRVVIGALFIWHGIDKFDGGIDMVEGAFSSWGVPAPALTAPLTAAIELLAGVALVLGIGTRIAAMLLSVVMIGALIYVKQDLGVISSEPMPGAELDLALLAGLVALVVIGPGRVSIDEQVGLEPASTTHGRDPSFAGG